MKSVDEDGGSTEMPNLPINELIDHFQGLPTALFACNVHEDVFNLDSFKEEFEQMFETFGPAEFIYLPSFRRVRVNYETPQEAAQAKLSLHGIVFKQLEIAVYFAQAQSSDDSSASNNLLPPLPDKQFLISPPASPPVGWEPVDENKPTINFDLISTLVEMAPGQTHELHKGTENQPSVVVHVCESTKKDEDLPKQKIQQTRRPGL